MPGPPPGCARCARARPAGEGAGVTRHTSGRYDAAMKIAPFQRWAAVARTQLANHKHYLASEYYAKQDYIRHYSARMRRLIQQQRTA